MDSIQLNRIVGASTVVQMLHLVFEIKDEPLTDTHVLMARRRLRTEKQIHYKTMSCVKLLEMDRRAGGAQRMI